MLTANQIIDDLGGTKAVADALDLSATTVSSWRPANFIPRWRHEKLLALALAKGVPLSTADFPVAANRVSRAKVAA